jgi:hypothetical protein
MSLVTNITNLTTRVATEIKALRTLVNGNAADLSALTTTNKTNLVASLNELQSAINAIDLTDLISDTTTGTATTWSSTKIDSAISTAVSALVDGAPGVLDTLNELAAALGDDADFATSISNSIALKADLVHTHDVGDVTGLQTALDGKVTSADVGDTTTNYVTTFEAGLV